MVNPVELLKLNYYELEHLSPEIIEQAKTRLLSEAGPEGIAFKQLLLRAGEVEDLAKSLDAPGQLAFFYQLSQYPGLSRLLEGDTSATIEAGALGKAGFTENLTPLLMPFFGEVLARALETGSTKELQQLGQELAQGDTNFQAGAFKAGMAIVEEKKMELESLAQSLQTSFSEATIKPLRGLQQMRASYPVAVFNTLPDYFSHAREGLARAMGKLVHAIWEKDPPLALAIARYARQLDISKNYAEKLDQAIGLIQKKAAKQQKDLDARKNRTWIAAGGAALLALMLFGLALSLNSAYDRLVGFFYEPALFSDTKALEEAGIDSDDIALLQEALSKKGSLSREEMEAILNKGGSRTQVVEYDALQLPWQERGKATKLPLKGEVELGSAPMEACFPTNTPSGKQNQQITIVGDANYDALVFFFNGRNYIRQAYLPAKSEFVLKGIMDEQQVLSTMIIFGKNWDPAAASPCGTPGYFTQNVHYSGFAGYAIDPVYPDLRSDLAAYLKKSRLLPSRELEENDFFDMLEKYR